MSLNESMGNDSIQQINTPEHVQIEIVEETRRRHRKLYVAALKGKWDEAEKILKNNPGDVRAELSDVKDTILHAATVGGSSKFVEELLNNYMEDNNLNMRNEDGNTAFSIAAMSGNTRIVELMLERNKELAMIPSGKGTLPVFLAALLGHERMVRCLYEVTKCNLTNENRIELLVKLIDNNLYDVALSMVKEFPELAVSRVVETKEKGKTEEIRETKEGKTKEKGETEEIRETKEKEETEETGETALHALARKPLRFYDFDKSNQGTLKKYYYQLSGTNRAQNKTKHSKALQLVELLWENVVNQLDYKKIRELIEPKRLIFDAANEGNFHFLSIILREHPDLLFEVNEETYSIFHTAVLYRHEKIFKLMDERPYIKNVIAAMPVGKNKEDNILHLAANLPPDQNRLKIVSGAALQMQRELWWFKEVNKLMPPCCADAKNSKKETARTLFTDSHKDLMKQGEKWMKTTAKSCMIVAALITTIVFAAAFTVPGGVKDDTGTPNFIKKASFKIFAISDAISLISSASSILAFLSILTARYAEEDFLLLLPTMLLFGLSTLFISIIGLMVVFCATLFIVFNEGTTAPAVLAIALSIIPVSLFISQQKCLIFDVFGLISKSLYRESQDKIKSLFRNSQNKIKGGANERGA